MAGVDRGVSAYGTHIRLVRRVQMTVFGTAADPG
jgi:hypothetical protein